MDSLRVREKIMVWVKINILVQVGKTSLFGFVYYFVVMVTIITTWLRSVSIWWLWLKESNIDCQWEIRNEQRSPVLKSDVLAIAADFIARKIPSPDFLLFLPMELPRLLININRYSFWSFAKLTDAVVFLGRIVANKMSCNKDATWSNVLGGTQLHM